MSKLNEKVIYAPDIPRSIDGVLEHLKPNGQGRQALLHANLLLTHLMALLRPIRIKKREAGGPRVKYTAEQLGLRLQTVRFLKDAVARGIREIENGDHRAARETFEAALDSWHEQKPTPEAPRDRNHVGRPIPGSTDSAHQQKSVENLWKPTLHSAFPNRPAQILRV